MKIFNCDQGSEEWMALRIGNITSSRIYKLISKGRVRESLLYKISAERITKRQCDSDIFSNGHIKRGHELEDEARLLYEMKNNISIENVGFVRLNKWVGSSPDGLVGKDGSIEIKSKDIHTFLETIDKGMSGIEKSHIYQMQFNMYVCKRKWCDYVIYNKNYSYQLHTIRVEKDKQKIEEIKRVIKDSILKLKSIIKNYNHLEEKKDGTKVL